MIGTHIQSAYISTYNYSSLFLNIYLFPVVDKITVKKSKQFVLSSVSQELLVLNVCRLWRVKDSKISCSLVSCSSFFCFENRIIIITWTSALLHGDQTRQHLENTIPPMIHKGLLKFSTVGNNSHIYDYKVSFSFDEIIYNRKI